MFCLDIATCIRYIGADEAYWQHCQAQLAAGQAACDVAADLQLLRNQLTAQCNAEAGRATLKRLHAAIQAAGAADAEGFCLAVLGWMLPDAVRLHKSMGADDAQIAATFYDTLRWANWHRRETGRIGMAELHWAVLPYAGQLFQIGCLQYQPNQNHLPVHGFAVSGSLLLLAADGAATRFVQEADHVEGHLVNPASGSIAPTATCLPTAGFRQVVAPGTPVLSLHIPAGADLTPAVVDESLRAARSFFTACGIPAEVCICYSWMLNPQLAEFFAQSSRVLMLANRFARIAVPGGQGGMDRFVFATDRPLAQITPAELRTSLQHKLYAYRTAGNILPDFGGVMLL